MAHKKAKSVSQPRGKDIKAIQIQNQWRPAPSHELDVNKFDDLLVTIVVSTTRVGKLMNALGRMASMSLT